MKFRAILILVLYLFATVGVTWVLFRMLGVLVVGSFDWFGAIVVGIFIGSVVQFASENPLLFWFYALVWGCPVWFHICLPIAQIATIPLFVRSTDVATLGRRSLIAPSLACGMMGGGLVVSAFVTTGFLLAAGDALPSGFEDRHFAVITWTILTIGILVWAGWTVICLRNGRNTPSMSVFIQQCRFLLRVGVVYLLAGVALLSFHKIDDGFSASLAIIGAICTLSFALQPRAFSFLMRRWKDRDARASTDERML